MKVKPLNCSVVIELDSVEEVTDGGIILAQEAIDNKAQLQVKATVLDVGPEAWEDFPESACKAGDRVILRRHSWVKVIMEDDEENDIVLVNDTAILARIEDE